MKLTIVAIAVPLFVTACGSHLGEPSAWGRSVPGPRDRYEAELARSELANSILHRTWVDEGRRALRSGLSIRPSFREIVRFSYDGSIALGYRLDLRRGQRLHITFERRSFDGRLFAELFEVVGSADPIYRVVQSSNAKDDRFSFEARTDGVHVVRIQPELMKQGEVAITLTTAAALTFPVAGKTSHAIGSYFGDPRDGGKRDHEGIDIFAEHGTRAIAVADGVITQVAHTNIGGLIVWQHDPLRGVEYYYAHLSAQDVQVGQQVSAGTTIGRVGNTGNARTTPPHLHFAVYKPGRVAVDPVPFIFDAPGDAVAPVMVDLTRLGSWTATAAPATLHTAPASGAPVLADVPPGTVLRVVSGVRTWHRVRLEDGRSGFITGQVTLLGRQ
jgi:murein DD-endopeptidase MepM/ murein hydrolase activator NlpD